MTRLSGTDNIDAAFCAGAEKIKGKDGRLVVTTKNLSAYASLFSNYFSGTPNLFDAGKSGIPLAIPRISELELIAFLELQKNSSSFCPPTQKNREISALVRDFYVAEEGALIHLRDLLSSGERAMSAEEKNAGNLSYAILELLLPRDYLYLHFPDGFSPNSEPQFLKRVRAEIDFFLKDIHTGLFLLEKAFS